jgi:hypothetical protein
MSVMKTIAAILLAANLTACNPFAPDPKGWYIKSIKGDTLTLHHEHKTFVVKCKGVMFKGNNKLITPCAYLAQYVGKTKSDGTGVNEIQRVVDITYYTDRHGEEGTHEIYEIIEETAQ